MSIHEQVKMVYVKENKIDRFRELCKMYNVFICWSCFDDRNDTYAVRCIY
jgi:hypothetical protein